MTWLVFCKHKKRLLGTIHKTVPPYDVKCPYCAPIPSGSPRSYGYLGDGKWRIRRLRHTNAKEARYLRMSHFMVSHSQRGMLDKLGELGFKLDS